MKLPSLQHVVRKSTLTLKRFPFVLLSAFIAVSFAVYLIDQSYVETEYLFNIILVCALGIPLFTVIRLTEEQKLWSTLTKVIINTGAFLLLLGYYFTLPDDLDTAPYKHLYRFMLFVLGVHLLVAIGPYWMNEKINAFWQYNKTIFLRFLTAVFFTGVLFIGLAVALGSVEVLLEVDVDEIRYFQLFVILTGIFNTWFFLAGIPSSLAVFESNHTYPKGLKIFTQNILIPLVIIYLCILYLYTGKIILQWTWPEGWVAYLVLSFSIVGILALLLLYPIRDKAENRWIKPFSSGFFIALIPLVVLLLLAIFRRIWEYSFTVERYFVLILGLWLGGVVLYFLFSRKQNIKVIPASLCVLAFLSSFGPWGAFSVSERSQINRLETYLIQNDMLQSAKIQTPTATVPFQDRREISNIIQYLHGTHGLGGIQPWFDQDFDQLTTTEADSTRPVNYYNRPEHVVQLMGIEYVNRYNPQPTNPSFKEFYTTRDNLIDVSDVNIIIQGLHWSPQDTLQQKSVGTDRTLFIQSDTSNSRINFYTSPNKSDAISIDMHQIIKDLCNQFPANQHEVPANAMNIYRSNGSFSIKIYFERIMWQRTERDSINLQSINFDVGLK